jgi:hypothetical protein
MLTRTTRLSSTLLSLLALGALLAACGGDKTSGSTGNNGGGGSGNTTSGSTGSSMSTTSSTSTGSASKGCVDLCTAFNACPGAMPGNCATDCPAADQFNTASGCASKYQALVDCALALTDPCTAYAGQDCQTESADYITCTSDYCTANPMAAGCQ